MTADSATAILSRRIECSPFHIDSRSATGLDFFPGEGKLVYVGLRMGDGLRELLQTLDPKARDELRRLLIRDQADRDSIASHLLRYRDERGDDWADIIDMLTMHPEERRKVVRLLGEIRGNHRRRALSTEES